MYSHDDLLEVRKKFENAIILQDYAYMVDIVNEIAYAVYTKSEDAKNLIHNFLYGKFEVLNKKYQKISNMIDANSIIDSIKDKKIEWDVFECLLSIGYAESSAKKLIKEFKNDTSNMSNNEYVLAVMETIPQRSKYKKPSIILIEKIKKTM